MTKIEIGRTYNFIRKAGPSDQLVCLFHSPVFVFVGNHTMKKYLVGELHFNEIDLDDRDIHFIAKINAIQNDIIRFRIQVDEDTMKILFATK